MHRRSLLGTAAALVLLVAACGHPPPPPPRVAEDPETLAAAALERGDYVRAAALYRQAIEQRPGSVSGHYGLGVATSNLDQRADTIREFQWVVANGRADSAEVRAAREWLITAGVLRRPVTPIAQPDSDRGWSGSLEGQAYLGSSDQRQPQTRLQLHLVGQPDSPTKEERRVLRTDNEGRFQFTNVVAGQYMLTDRIAGKPGWRLKVEVSAGSTLRLDLSPSNRADVRDDFPGRG
jgi:hypothetical protein